MASPPELKEQTMRQTVVGVFNDHAAAIIAAQTLEAGGFEHDSVHVSDTSGDDAVPEAALVVIDVEEEIDVDAARQALASAGAQDIDQRAAAEAGSQTAAGQPMSGSRGYEDYEADFRQHFEAGDTGKTGRYEDAEPGYRHGHAMAQDARYAGRQWNDVEPEARRDWEQRYPGGAWERIKAAVRHAWERVKS
jgi:hypothetical protein